MTTDNFNTKEFKDTLRICMDKLFSARYQIDTSLLSALSSVNWTIGCLEAVVENLQRHCVEKEKGGD